MKKITIDLPEEFLTLCTHDDAQPEAVLRGFIADLCSLSHSKSNPRTDGYTSNGSDERLMARDYYARVGWPYFKSVRARK